MARSFEEQYAEKKNTLIKAFNDTNKPVATQKGKEQQQSKVEETEDEDWQERVAREQTKILNERSAPQPLPSYGVQPDLSQKSIHAEAIRRVNEKMDFEKKERMNNMEKENEQNTKQSQASDQSNNVVTQDQRAAVKLEQDHSLEDTPELDEETKLTFKAEMHRIVQETQKLRLEASRTFIQNRKNLIVEAEKLGASEPERDVSIAQRNVHNIIDADEHKQLHSLFQKHGWNYDKQNVEFLENEEGSQENIHEADQHQIKEQNISHGEDQ